MDKILQEILKLVLEIKKISNYNNNLLGFVSSRVSPMPPIIKEHKELMSISMEMSEIFDKYNITADEFGIS
jgi:hypothetical protein